MNEDPEAIPADEILAVETDLEAGTTILVVQEKCTKQCAQIAGKNVKYPSNRATMHRATLDQCTVETVTKTTKNTKERDF